MTILVFFVFNLLLMSAVFLYGMYQFMQVEEKRKRRDIFAQAALDEAALNSLIQSEGYDEARARLMASANVDRFTAETVLDHISQANPAEPGAQSDVQPEGNHEL